MKTSANTRGVLRLWVPIVCYIMAVAVQFGIFALVRYLGMVVSTIAAWIVFGAVILVLLLLLPINSAKLRAVSLKMNAAEDISSNLFADMTPKRNSTALKVFSHKVNGTKFNIVFVKIFMQLLSLLSTVLFAGSTLVAEKAVWVYYVIPFVIVLVSPFLWLDLVAPFVGSIDEFALSDKEYPELYNLAGEVANDLGSNLPVKIFPDYGNGISAEVVHGQLEVFLSCELVALLTRQELKNLLLCEVTIALKTNNKRNREYNRFFYSMTSLNNVFSKLLFSGFFEQFNYFRRFQFIYEQRCVELLGNEAVKQHGDAQIYLNACAKLASYNFFHEEDLEEFEIKLHSHETFPSNYFVIYLDEYRRFRDENFFKLNLYLKKCLQTDKDTRSTFADKMKYFQLDSFDYCQVQEQNDYLFETQSLLMVGCNMILTNAAGRFQFGRKGFLHDQSRYDRYLYLKNSGEKFTHAQKVGYLQLLYSMDRNECLLRCNEILAKYPQNAYACFYKGVYLAAELDDGCVPLLYSACSNPRLRRDALNEIGQFACNVGNEKLFFEFRDSDATVSTHEKNDYANARAKILLHEPVLPQETLEQLTKHILDLAGASAESLSFASDAAHENKLCMLLQFRYFVPSEEAWDVTHSVAAYLDAFSEESMQRTEFRMAIEGRNVPLDKLSLALLNCSTAVTFSNQQF